MAKNLYVTHGPTIMNGEIIHSWFHTDSPRFYQLSNLDGYRSQKQATEAAKIFAKKEGMTNVIVLSQGGKVVEEIEIAA